MKRLLASILVIAMISASAPGALADGLPGITILRPAGAPPAPTMPPAVASTIAPVVSVGTAPALIAGGPVATSAPVAGDLTHLTFTATTGLWARIEAPTAESAQIGGAMIVQVQTGLGQGAEVQINGAIVPFSNIGRRVVDSKSLFTDYTYYGVPLQSGANHLIVTPLGAGTLRGKSVAETIYGPGAPESITAQSEGRATADGTSIVVLHVQAFDASHHPAMPGSVIKATIDGDAHFIGDADASGHVPQSQSAELVVQMGGSASIRVLAGLRTGDVNVALNCGTVHADHSIFFAPALRAPMVVGLATVGMGSVPGAPGEDPTVADGTNSRSGRFALYATGDVGAQTLATLAYDTADSLARSAGYGAFAAPSDLDNRPYQTYGDASVTRDDALSDDHLYLRLDRGRSNFTWGEFQAQTGETTGPDAGDGFNLLVDGAKLEVASSASKLTLFNARNDIAYGRQIFTPLGLSSLGNLLQPNIVVGSDIVTLVVLDQHTGAILQQTVLTENVDYTIDYNTGQMRFINIPLPFDTNFNPQEIVVQYEYDGNNVDAETTGGRFQVALDRSQKTHVGLGYVNDAYGSGNFSLLSTDIGGALLGGAWSIEHLTSAGSLTTGQSVESLGGTGTGGSALRAALNTATGANKFNLTYDATSAGFDNPFGGISTPGLLNYSGAYTRLLPGGRGDISATYTHEQNTLPTSSSSQSEASLALREKMSKRFSITAELDSITGPSAAGAAAASPGPSPAPNATATPVPVGPTSTSMQAKAGFDWLVLPKVDLAASRSQDIGDGTSASQPAQTSAELGFNFNAKGHAYVRELWSATPAQSFASSTQSLTSTVSGTHSTEIGIDHTLGTQTTVTSDYTIQQAGSGSNIYSSLGVQEKLPINKFLHGDATLQHAVGIGQGSSGFNVYGLDLAYNTTRMRASGSYQLRTGDSGGATLALGATGALSPDFSLFASVNDSNAGGIADDESRVGVAYRPSNNDRAATLLQYDSAVSNSSALGSRADTLSLDEIVRPSNSLEVAGRYAYKLSGDSYYPAQSELFGLRATQRVGPRADIGAEVRYLDVRNIPNASATGFAVETGMRLGDGMRLALGYNFSGSPDPQLAAAPTRRGVYVTLTSVIDRIFGWGR